MSELPKRKPMPVGQNQRPTFMKFSELINLSHENLKIYFKFTNSLYIDDYELMKKHFDILQFIVTFKGQITIYSDSYECLKFIEDNIKYYYLVRVVLIDDFQNRDRSYINTEYFKRTKFSFPFSYIMWNVQMQTDPKVACYYHKDNLNPFCTNLYDQVSLESLKQIREIIFRLGELSKNCSNADKIILISDYLQNLVQFVDTNNVSHGQKGIYITNPNGKIVDIKSVGNPENVLLNHFGVCNGIAHATTMLLNNPEMNVNARSVYGMGHSWNIVLPEDKFYYVDNTWSITRNKDQYPESLKARSFDSTYLLFGEETAKTIGYHIPEVYIPNVEKEDFSQEELESAQKRLVHIAKFSEYNKPIFSSTMKK